MNDRLFRWGPVVLVASGILVASVVRTAAGEPAMGPLGVGVDKWLHAVGYGVLAGTIAVALGRRPTAGALALVVGLTVGYGIVIELVQLPLSYRSASLLDVVADGVGAVVAAVLYWVRQSTPA
ncbi:VanZ family protein [Salinibaculum rarum]|uniref:VanZ family protein n=1 Tax=Salinibaculum rarum TaxID=3058903 RepID=UPI00265E7456|nr:VanZ family protein [Salinibaculum sp. KK48]